MKRNEARALKVDGDIIHEGNFILEYSINCTGHLLVGGDLEAQEDTGKISIQAKEGVCVKGSNWAKRIWTENTIHISGNNCCDYIEAGENIEIERNNDSGDLNAGKDICIAGYNYSGNIKGQSFYVGGKNRSRSINVLGVVLMEGDNESFSINAEEVHIKGNNHSGLIRAQKVVIEGNNAADIEAEEVHINGKNTGHISAERFYLNGILQKK